MAINIRLAACMGVCSLALTGLARADDFTWQSEPINLGMGGFDSDGMAERLAPQWLEVASCDVLTRDADGTLYHYIGAFDDDELIDVACAMEDQGHRIDAAVIANAEHSSFGMLKPRTFYRAALAEGGSIILDGEIGGSQANDAGDEVFLLNFFYQVWNADNGRSYYIPRSEQVPPGDAGNEIVGYLLGQSEFDLEKIGITSGGGATDIEPPAIGEIASGFRRGLNRHYPKHDCSYGFRSTLQISSAIEVCVNYREFEEFGCEGEGAEYLCEIEFLVTVGSSTHPGMNAQFARQNEVMGMTAKLVHSASEGWVVDMSERQADRVVPREFRGRAPFGR